MKLFWLEKRKPPAAEENIIFMSNVKKGPDCSNWPLYHAWNGSLFPPNNKKSKLTHFIPAANTAVFDQIVLASVPQAYSD